MAVIVKGKFLAATLKQRIFNGAESNSIELVVFDPDNAKSVNIEIQDLKMLDVINKQYKQMDDIEVSVSLYPSAKQVIYYRFIDFVAQAVPLARAANN